MIDHNKWACLLNRSVHKIYYSYKSYDCARCITTCNKKKKKYTSRTVARHRRSHMSRAGWGVGVICVQNVWVYARAHEHDSFPVGRSCIYGSELYEMTMGRRVRAVFHVGGCQRGGGIVVVCGTKKTYWEEDFGGGAQRLREKNFGEHTLELHAPSLTYCEMRRFFRFSFYFSPSRGDRETIFPRFSPDPRNNNKTTGIEWKLYIWYGYIQL